jgi:uncharacterized membrane protein YcaP (DUF421 family)
MLTSSKGGHFCLWRASGSFQFSCATVKTVVLIVGEKNVMVLTFMATAVWSDMLTLKIPVSEKILRSILVYVFLVVMLRVFGKRELAQLNPFDLVVLLSLSNTVQNAIIGDDNSLIGGFVGAFSLLAVNYFVVRFLFRHRRLDQLIEGKPTPLIQNGKMHHRNIAKELLTTAELTAVAHRQGFASLSELDSCVLEPGGTFVLKSKTPSTDEARHAQLVERLDKLTTKVEELSSKLA